jgi:ribosomal 30S subunit maturation factor RimM
MAHDPAYLVVGHLSKPHGTRGELVVWPLTDRPDEVFAPGRRLLLGTDAGEWGTRRWTWWWRRAGRSRRGADPAGRGWRTGTRRKRW